ncbi:hypothetical protein CEUSTIGMA_g11079.t1 [Chlamydomonas eustigma]|uniref:Uncharacterized protein n=1 Tax=Chlamydomonas eustigma TaxID=1157962 RepID=A0A250XKQ4_9CHLO|nr:hypothetical protein CEUSTIGMA_g11079.t1 [Chlamydomonas eustigma]|eukprot:GAX83654.1 hypothetical protein CEUSTIGMA_g11079.t1 [Chlamydomonas eustigma]
MDLSHRVRSISSKIAKLTPDELRDPKVASHLSVLASPGNHSQPALSRVIRQPATGSGSQGSYRSGGPSGHHVPKSTNTSNYNLQPLLPSELFSRLLTSTGAEDLSSSQHHDSRASAPQHSTAPTPSSQSAGNTLDRNPITLSSNSGGAPGSQATTHAGAGSGREGRLSTANHYLDSSGHYPPASHSTQSERGPLDTLSTLLMMSEQHLGSSQWSTGHENLLPFKAEGGGPSGMSGGFVGHTYQPPLGADDGASGMNTYTMSSERGRTASRELSPLDSNRSNTTGNRAAVKAAHSNLGSPSSQNIRLGQRLVPGNVYHNSGSEVVVDSGLYYQTSASATHLIRYPRSGLSQGGSGQNRMYIPGDRITNDGNTSSGVGISTLSFAVDQGDAHTPMLGSEQEGFALYSGRFSRDMPSRDRRQHSTIIEEENLSKQQDYFIEGREDSSPGHKQGDALSPAGASGTHSHTIQHQLPLRQSSSHELMTQLLYPAAAAAAAVAAPKNGTAATGVGRGSEMFAAGAPTLPQPANSAVQGPGVLGYQEIPWRHYNSSAPIGPFLNPAASEPGYKPQETLHDKDISKVAAELERQSFQRASPVDPARRALTASISDVGQQRGLGEALHSQQALKYVMASAPGVYLQAPSPSGLAHQRKGRLVVRDSTGQLIPVRVAEPVASLEMNRMASLLVMSNSSRHSTGPEPTYYAASKPLTSLAAAGLSPSTAGRVLIVDPTGKLVLLNEGEAMNAAVRDALKSSPVDLWHLDTPFAVFSSAADATGEVVRSRADHAQDASQTVPPRSSFCSLHVVFAVALIVLLILNLFVLVFCIMLHVVTLQAKKHGASGSPTSSEL